MRTKCVVEELEDELGKKKDDEDTEEASGSEPTDLEEAPEEEPIEELPEEPEEGSPDEGGEEAVTEFTEDDAAAALEELGIDPGDVDMDQLVKGMNVELEHGSKNPDLDVTGDDPVTTAKIALAHIREIPDYYLPRLQDMEDAAKAGDGEGKDGNDVEDYDDSTDSYPGEDNGPAFDEKPELDLEDEGEPEEDEKEKPTVEERLRRTLDKK